MAGAKPHAQGPRFSSQACFGAAPRPPTSAQPPVGVLPHPAAHLSHAPSEARQRVQWSGQARQRPVAASRAKKPLKVPVGGVSHLAQRVCRGHSVQFGSRHWSGQFWAPRGPRNERRPRERPPSPNGLRRPQAAQDRLLTQTSKQASSAGLDWQAERAHWAACRARLSPPARVGTCCRMPSFSPCMASCSTCMPSCPVPELTRTQEPVALSPNPSAHEVQARPWPHARHHGPPLHCTNSQRQRGM